MLKPCQVVLKLFLTSEGFFMSSQGTNLKKIRIALGLSQEVLGQGLAVSKQYISNLEANRNVLNNEKLDILAIGYNVNLNFLFTGVGSMFLNNCENTHALMKNDKPIVNYKNWGKRLLQILSDAQETPYAFSKRTGIKESRIEKFILDSVDPTISEINAIKSNVDVSLDWLFYDEAIEKGTQSENIGLSAGEILKIKKLLNNSKI